MTSTRDRARRAAGGPLGLAAALALALAHAACGGAAEGGADAARDAEADPGADPHLRIVRLLSAGEAVFGIFSGDHTPEAGAAMAENRETDFVFYSLESGPFDLPTMEAYAAAMAEAAGERGTHPLALRIPPIRDGAEEARDRVRRGLDAGVAAIVFPHVESADEAALAVASMEGAGLWPIDPEGPHVNMLIVEDRVGVENAAAIAATPGVSVVFAGPGDLSRAYEGEMEAIEAAIQTVLAACLDAGVPCGITAGADDIATRLEQGFRVIIVTGPEALPVGRAAAGRDG